MRSIVSSRACIENATVLLAPAGIRAPDAFQCVESNPQLRSELLASMQRFRGGVYLQDGAILPDELTSDGRHHLDVDEHSWHFLTLRENGTVCACLRFLEQPGAKSLNHLWVRESALARSPVWSTRFKSAVQDEILYARTRRIRFGEVGGWAIAPERRKTLDPMRAILGTYGLLQLLGGCSGIATATHRHGSAPMLRRIGLSPLADGGVELPAYYDPRYRCQMEVLRFDSRYPNPKFQPWIEELTGFLATAPVICNTPVAVVSDPSPWKLPVAAPPVPALAGSY